MVRRIAMLYDGLYVLLGRIPHVPFPSVLRVFLRQLPHVLVPVGLREDGRRRDRRELCIAFYHTLVFISVKRLELVAVYQQVFRLDLKPPDSPLHACYRCVEDVYGVDLLGADLLDGPRYRLPLDDRAERLPGLFGHLLGVVEKRVVEVLRQYDGGGEDRAGQRAASRLVAARLDEVCVQVA